jgi:hemolysin activation/secretion protein
MMKSPALPGLLAALSISTAFGTGPDEANKAAPPEARNGEKSERDTAGAVKAGEDQILLPKLSGIVVAPEADGALKLQSSGQPGVQISGFSEAETTALRTAAESAIGEAVSLRSLEALGTKLEAAMKAGGRPFMQATFPDQEITSGIIAIRICEAHAGKVLMSGRPAFGLKFAADAFRTASGQPLDEGRILADLEWLNENPLRRASISYADGATPETLDLTLKLRAAKPWRVYAGIDNQLSDRLGDERLFAGFQYGDVFGLDHRMTTQITAALDVERLKGISGSYEIPLPDRTLLQVSAGYTEVDSPSAGLIDQSGRYSRIALDYRVPLPRWNGLSHEWRAGLELRENAFEFPSGIERSARFFQIEAGWKGRLSDRFGSTRIDASLHYAPGNGIFGSEDQDFIALGGESAESLIAQLEAERTWSLDDAGQLVGKMKAQWSDTTLLPSDQIAASGAARVRGFDETKGFADNGLVLTFEWQSPYWHAGDAGDFQALTFLDAGFLDSHQGNEGSQLAAIGVGVRWRLDEHLTAKADLGFPIDNPDADKADPRLQFSITTTW